MKTRVRRIACMLCIVLFVSQCGFIPTDNTSKTLSKESLLSSLFEADIRAIQVAYKTGLLTCRELTEYYLERISAYNESFNCFITLCEDEALKRAREIDFLIASGETDGLLLGIPLVIKDNIDYAGYHTTNGHWKSYDQIAYRNADIVDYLLQEGAVIIGKTNMSTDAQDARISASEAVGETKNAYGLDLASGGSSGGSAVATSLNLAVAGLGTDTNSSLRLPAALNGCISLRVTWNTLSTEGVTYLNRWRDVPGVITRTVMDQAILLDVLSGGDTAYAKNLDSTVLQGLRMGVIEELSYINSSHVDREVVAAFETALQELKSCGAEIVKISLPGVEYWYDKYDDTADFRRNALGQFESVMEEENISAVIFPTYLSSPLYSGRDDDGVYHDPSSQPFLNNCRYLSPNLAIPEISIPIGNHSRGAGIGMEIAAGKYQEQLLLDIAYAYTLAYDHRQVPKEAPNLYQDSYEGCLGDLVSDHIAALDSVSSERASNVPPSTNSNQKPDPSPTEFGVDMDDITEIPVTEEEGITGSDEAKLLSPAIRGNSLRLICVILPLVIFIIVFKKHKKRISSKAEKREES